MTLNWRIKRGESEKRNSKRRGFQLVSRSFPSDEAVKTNQLFVLKLKCNGTDMNTISQTQRNQMDNAKAYSRSLELKEEEARAKRGGRI